MSGRRARARRIPPREAECYQKGVSVAHRAPGTGRRRSSGTLSIGTLATLAGMVPILGGLGAALLFTVSVLASARASRLIGASSTVAWAMAVGFIVTLPVASSRPPAPDFGHGTLAWFIASGVGNVVGLLLTYAAYRIGAVAVIVTIASTEGAIAAVLAVIVGEVLVPERRRSWP